MSDRFDTGRLRRGLLAGAGPILNRFFNEPRLGVMLRKDLGLCVPDFSEMGFESLADFRTQLFPGTAQKALVSSILHERVLEAVNRVRRHASLEHQLGSDQPSESRLQLVS